MIPNEGPGCDKPRIGVYICHCGTNIAGKVDVAQVAEFAKNLPNVVISRDYKFMCSDPGQELIQKDIKENNLTMIVVASCSPLLHEATFRKATKDGGLNEFCFQMANIREQVSWVTEDKGEATAKAKAMVAAAVRRVALAAPLERRKVPVHADVMVVGGGISGIHAALTMANSGKKVYLVEREPTIGGYMAKFDKTFPTLDCSACILTPKMSSVKSHPNITLWSYSEVVQVDGSVGDFKVKVKRKTRYVNEKLCIGCYECVEACVFKEPKYRDEFNEGLSKRKPVYIPFPQATPLVATIDPVTCIQVKTGKCKMTCKTACPKDCIDFDLKDTIEEVTVGAVVLATGFQVFDPSGLHEYGYGKYDDVYSSIEIERLINTAGPTGGVLKMKNGQTPKSVAIFHCVGSRDKNTNRWCSRVCCMYSLKLAHLVKERTDAEVFNFYIDMRTPGKSYEEFYDRLLEEGVHFIRGKGAEVRNWSVNPEEKGKLVVRAEDTLINVIRHIPVDMVILSVGLEPRSDAEAVRKLFNISCSTEGWFLERHPKLAPVSTFTDGVFIAGACQGPKDIPDCVAQAGGAAAEALALIDKGFVELEPDTAWVEEELCTGCKTCLLVCPYQAITRDDEKGVAVINETLCKGCGTCVATCPSAAIQQHLFTDKEIFEEIEGVLAYV